MNAVLRLAEVSWNMRLFNPKTAREALAAVRPSAEVMTRAFRSMEALKPERLHCDRPVDREYFQLARVLIEAIETLEHAGVLVKDARGGLLDFPARRAGRVVMLCWRVGESALGFWHEEGAGFAGRMPVDEDGPWEGLAAGGEA